MAKTTQKFFPWREAALWIHPSGLQTTRREWQSVLVIHVLLGPVHSGCLSVSGVLAVGAVAHVFRVELYLDGDAVETKLGVE